MNIEIRPAAEGDYHDIDQLMIYLHDMHVSNRPDMYKAADHVYSYDEYMKILDDANSFAFVALDLNIIVGLCFLTFRQSTENPIMVPAPVLYIEDLCVHKDYQHKGIGEKLYQQAIQTAKNQGAKRVELTVWSFNQNAIDFYEHLGMRPQRTFLEVNI